MVIDCTVMKYKNILLVAVLLIVTFLLNVHSINSGMLTDDFIQKTYALGNQKLKDKQVYNYQPDSSFLGFTQKYFIFLDSEKMGLNQSYFEYGATPWWSFKDVKVAFWRPVTSATYWLDYKLWPDSSKAMHFQNIFWFMLLIIAVYTFYRKTLNPTWAVFLAASLFVIDYSFIKNAGWLACRNATMATLFGIFSILSFIKYKQSESSLQLFFSVILFLLSILSAEAGIATMAYIASYAICLDKKPLKNRFISIIPFLITIIAWRVIYKLLGYGTSGTEMYIDPISNFSGFTEAITTRAPVLFFYQLIGTDGIDYIFNDSLKKIFIFASYLTVAIFCILPLKILIKDKISRFYLFGAIFAVIPICTTYPSGRILMFVALGIIGFLISIIYNLTSGKHISNLSLSNAIPLWIFVVLILVISIPVNLLFWGKEISNKSGTPHSPKMLGIGDEPEIADKDVIVINANNPFAFIFEPFTRAYSSENLEVPNHIRALTTALNDISITRENLQTIIMEPKGGFLLTANVKYPEDKSQIPLLHSAHSINAINGHFRGSDMEFEAGEKISLPEVEIEILEVTDNGQPKTVKFEFIESLENNRFKWLFWNWESMAYEEFTLPGIGKKVTVNGPFSKSGLIKKK